MTDTLMQAMTGPDHVREALRLADLAEQQHIDLPGGNGACTPSDEQRHRLLMHAHLHASLAHTAAMVDSRRYNDGTVSRDRQVERAWHEVFNVD